MVSSYILCLSFFGLLIFPPICSQCTESPVPASINKLCRKGMFPYSNPTREKGKEGRMFSANHEHMFYRKMYSTIFLSFPWQSSRGRSGGSSSVTSSLTLISLAGSWRIPFLLAYFTLYLRVTSPATFPQRGYCNTSVLARVDFYVHRLKYWISYTSRGNQYPLAPNQCVRA